VSGLNAYVDTHIRRKVACRISDFFRVGIPYSSQRERQSLHNVDRQQLLRAQGQQSTPLHTHQAPRKSMLRRRKPLILLFQWGTLLISITMCALGVQRRFESPPERTYEELRIVSFL
jgi:hypothetical protein